jgi:hypothetical protein
MTDRRAHRSNFRRSADSGAPDHYGRYDDVQPYPYPQRPHASWHIEKGVSISLIVFLIIQTVSIVWFAAQLTGQVKQNTSHIALMQHENKDRDNQRAEMLADLSSINQELRDMREIMIQSAGRPTQLVMPSSTNGAPPTINIEASPRSPTQSTAEPTR